MILQYKRQLESKGFSVSTEHQIFGLHADLYAEKGSEKRVYEFKVVGKNQYVKGHLSKFKEIVESNGATPYVVYVNPPVEKAIYFEDLDTILASFFLNGELPSELDSLSTHTSIDAIDIDDLTSIEISNGVITVEGNAIISVELQYGSSSDMKLGDGVKSFDNFPMTFRAEMEYCDKYSIVNIEHEIDTSSFYE